MLTNQSSKVWRSFFLNENNHLLLQKDILAYVDEQFCARLEGTAKENCKSMIDISDEELIQQIEQGTVSSEEGF